MHVVATAGHVDHGKSALVRALTGSDPDRLEEERRRGLSIELGYCWTGLPGLGDVAFVDVPGHERFVPTMLAGVGPVPVVLFVVAADDPWMPQAAEHLAALDALGVSRGVLVVTRADLADPGPALDRATTELAGTTLRDAPAVVVSARTGDGIDELRGRLTRVLASVEQPAPDADVRLWVDRSFHVKGAGTVVTGTLPAGTVSTGATLTADDGTATLRVRGIESLGRPVDTVGGVARVALNLSGAAAESLDRGSVLVTPDAWRFTSVADVRVTAGRTLPERPLVHVGAAAVGCHARHLDAELVRLTFDRALPLRVGDRALLRDPGDRTVWGVRVLDPAPPPLRRRGAAGMRAKELASSRGVPDAADELRRRGVVRRSVLRRIGVPEVTAEQAVVAGDWALDRELADALRRRLTELVRAHDRATPLDPGLPVGAAARALDLPSTDLVTALVAGPMRLRDGRVHDGAGHDLPAAVLDAVEEVLARLADEPFLAPDANRLRHLGLTTKSIAAASRAGLLLRVADTVVLAPGADEAAVHRLRALPQPFTTSQARAALGSTRRVVLPLLEHLDRNGLTLRHPDDRRELVGDH